MTQTLTILTSQDSMRLQCDCTRSLGTQVEFNVELYEAPYAYHLSYATVPVPYDTYYYHTYVYCRVLRVFNQTPQAQR